VQAFEHLLQVPRAPGACNTSFMLSWCYQMGAGVGLDPQESRRWLRAAVPHDWQQAFLLVESDWLRMIYGDDFTALGWS
jgi:TPR repeat protein